MHNYKSDIHVKQGDDIRIIFESDLTDECLTYELTAWMNSEYFLRSSFFGKDQLFIKFRFVSF